MCQCPTSCVEEGRKRIGCLHMLASFIWRLCKSCTQDVPDFKLALCPYCILGMLHPRNGKQLREHDSALPGKESGYTTNAKKQEIFSDMSYAPFTVADKIIGDCCLSTTPAVL